MEFISIKTLYQAVSHPEPVVSFANVLRSSCIFADAAVLMMPGSAMMWLGARFAIRSSDGF
jgi:hypothetical protein